MVYNAPFSWRFSLRIAKEVIYLSACVFLNQKLNQAFLDFQRLNRFVLVHGITF